MKKKILLLILTLVLTIGVLWKFTSEKQTTDAIEKLTIKKVKKKKKTVEERMLFSEERVKHELAFQINPLTGKIPLEEKEKEYKIALNEAGKVKRNAVTSSVYVSRGPSNLGGRTRSLVVDVSDATSNTIIAGGVSSGLFRTTNGGTSWTKVSSNSEIHNVTSIAQDSRAGHQNIWYYATGEWSGNSASLGSAYRGHGVYKSTNNGLSWTKIAVTNSNHHSFDSFFDYINTVKVSPLNGDLFIATTGRIYRYNGITMVAELEIPSNGLGWTDVKIAQNGRVYAAIQGTSSAGGVWTSPTGNGSWTRIAYNGSPAGWAATSRIVLGTAPSNNNVVYALYTNGATSGNIEADLWKYNLTSNSWTNYSSKLPDEPGGNLAGNDPFAVQGGYDLVVSVKPNDENFVVIGGTNTYKIVDITTDTMFTRIGGYKNNSGYAIYDTGGVQHHPDIHALVFDPNNSNLLFSGTDGGVHKADVTTATTSWSSLNNNYQTYQYYHVAMDSRNGSDIVIGGAQDNGTTAGGTNSFIGRPDNTSMRSLAGGDGVAVGFGREGVDPRFYLGFQNGPIYRFKNGYANIRPTGSSSEFVTYFYLDPDNNNALYYAGRNRLYYTNDANNVTPSSWTNAGMLPTSENLRTFATTRGVYSANSYLFIGGDRGGVFRVINPQNMSSSSLSTTAVNITPPTATTNNRTIVSGIAIHPTNPNIVLVVYANYGINNIYLTTNANAATPTWTLVENNLNNHSIRSAAIAQVGSETIYFVGTARGLYSSDSPTTKNWEIEGSNTIGLAVVSSLAYRVSDNKLLVGTHGNGMFQTTVQGVLSTSSFAQKSLGLSLYPNPTVDKIQFKSNLLKNNQVIKFEIFDIRGRSVKKGILTNKEINVSGLKSGAYVVSVVSENRKQSLKFVKK